MKSEIPPSPGFPTPLAIDDTSMHSHDQTKDERAHFPVRRRSSRKRVPPNLFVPTHSRPSPRPRSPSQGFRCRRGRPSKRSSDVSQSLRRGPGRPRRQRSDVTEAPASPLGSSGDSPLVSATTHTTEAVTPTSLGSTGDSPLQVSATANAPLGSTSYRPLEIPSDEEDTKLNVKSSSLLMRPPKTNHTPKILDEESKKVILKVESLLVKKLLSSENDVGYMVHQANATFTYLKMQGVDNASFYREVAEYISRRCDLLDAEKEETMFSLSALQENYENAVITANDVEEDFERTQGEYEKAKEKEKTLKRQMEDLKQELAHIKHEKERIKHDEIKYKEAHEVAKAKEQELGTQLEAAQAKRRMIEQQKNAALVGIESTSRRLKQLVGFLIVH